MIHKKKNRISRYMSVPMKEYLVVLLAVNGVQLLMKPVSSLANLKIQQLIYFFLQKVLLMVTEYYQVL